MRGQILNFDTATGAGQISGDDGVRYEFRREALRQQVTPWSGAAVDFVGQGANAVDIFVLNNAAAHSASGVAGSPGNDWGKLFFSIDGRIPRSRFWAGWGILLAARLVGGLIPFVNFIVAIGAIWADVCLNAKRLHDMGRSGWWQLIPYLMGIAAGVASFAFIMAMFAGVNTAGAGKASPDFSTGMVAGLLGVAGLSTLVWIGFLIWIGATPSEPRENRFGPPPGQNLANTFD